MKGYSVYSSIQQLKERGLKIATVAKQLGINRRTVNHYWDMAVEEYEENSINICREALLGKYRDTIARFVIILERVSQRK